ncbi:hypothetical protein B0A52_07860 [Exophiala mesophila]|uniref:Epoxide hydrolase N-terminal domain-containing protein n=1 Tax=Exophiala mesophila TaxID=212818 RepID=A0A438MVH7_EXOME|nr:hypothetical protein B0A52_07860 [Exophiala mesophila]
MTSITKAALNFKATFTQEVTPFNIEVDQDFLDNTRLKASLTRFVDDLEEQEAFTDGPPRQTAEKVADYWANKYDWRAIEADINSKLKQYTTLVETPTTKFTGPIPLHFVHHRSPREDAIPLIFVHGWPGSFLEVDNIIEPLTNPPDASMPAFHVVAPSIPGYGFSPSPRKPGFGYRQSGAAFHALMQKLGYKKYVFQGGDAGDLINRYMAVDFPESVVSGHSNFWVIPPNEDDLDKYRRNESSPDEKYLIELYGGFTTKHWAYGQIHQTRPLKLAGAMTDSPVGLAMWIYDSVVSGVPDPSIWTPELIITWTMMHWINGPYAAFSLYKNGAADGAISIKGINLLPYVKQPVAISQFPYDLWYRTPLDWAQRGGNVKMNTVHETGGHFAALTNADLLLQDIWRFFGDTELSNTNIFKQT